jgi:hypothetical protein
VLTEGKRAYIKALRKEAIKLVPDERDGPGEAPTNELTGQNMQA